MSTRQRKRPSRYSPTPENQIDALNLETGSASPETVAEPPPKKRKRSTKKALKAMESRLRQQLAGDMRQMMREEIRAAFALTQGTDEDSVASPSDTKKISIGNEFDTQAVPLGLHVKQEIKRDIADGKFIQMADLLKKENKDELEQLCYRKLDNGELVASVKKSKKKILSWEDWSAAWNIYTYLLYQEMMVPELPLQLAQHYNNVNELKDMKKNWRGYDETFRRMVEQDLTKWGCTVQEAFSKAMLEDDPHLVSHTPSTTKLQLKCHNFNKGACQKGDACRYQHICSICGKRYHNALQCWGRQRRPYSNSAGPSKPTATMPFRASAQIGQQQSFNKWVRNNGQKQNQVVRNNNY